MFIARVVGNIVSTQKQECYKGQKILVVREVNLNGEIDGPEQVALDGADVDAGIGDLVLVIQEGGSARLATRVEGLKPVDLAVVAIVDSIETTQGNLYQHS